MKTKILIFVIGTMFGAGLFVWQFYGDYLIFRYETYREKKIFDSTGELEYSFSSTTAPTLISSTNKSWTYSVADRGWAARKCAALGGISLWLNEDTYKATCYKFKQL